MKPAPLALCGLAITLAGQGDAAAQTETRTAPLYRCGPEGLDLRDSPCPANAKAPPSSVTFDQPSASQTRAAHEQAKAEAQRADALERERQRHEAQARRSNGHAPGIDGLASARTPAAAASAPAKGRPRKQPKAAKPLKPPKPPGTSDTPTAKPAKQNAAGNS
jgi:hypothetical protein